MMRRVTLLAALLLLSGVARSWAEPLEAEKTAQAKAHFQAGEVHFNLGEFAQALARYRQAYELQPLPPLLFNMAQCHRHLGELARAAFLLQRFLSLNPAEAQRMQAEAVLALVEAELKRPPAPASAPTAPATQTAPAPTRGHRAAPRSLAATPSAPDLQLAQPLVASPPAPAPPPLFKRWWFWTAVGCVVATTAAVAGVLATQDEARPAGSLAAVDFR